MSIQISGGPSGITVETDPTALKLTGGTLSGTLFLPTARNLLNADLNIVAYNDTGAGTTYTHSFKPFDGTFQLAANGGGLRFPDSTVQTTAGLPLTGGTLSGKVNLPSRTSGGPANLNLGSIPDNLSAPSTLVEGDVFLTDIEAAAGNFNSRLNYVGKTFSGSLAAIQLATLNGVSNFFSQTQTVVVTSTTPAVRITQQGTGHALLVEDSANPDTTATFISNTGVVCIGYDANSTFPSGAILNIKGGVNFDQAANSHTNAFSLYNREINVLVENVPYAIPCRLL